MLPAVNNVPPFPPVETDAKQRYHRALILSIDICHRNKPAPSKSLDVLDNFKMVSLGTNASYNVKKTRTVTGKTSLKP